MTEGEAPGPYALLRTALAAFKKPPVELGPEEREQALRQAQREFLLEQRILASPEAAGVVVSEEQVQHAMAGLRGRYENEEDFLADLARNGLDEQSLHRALNRQCRVEAVMDRVASRAPEVGELDVAIYYHSHRERFKRPEQREAFHLFLSINPDFAENTPQAARQRIEQIAATLRRDIRQFSELAQRNSECPTALQGGRIGWVARGQLFPQLDAALFALRRGELSPILETDLGLHLVYCRDVRPVQDLSLAEASPQIRTLLQERMRRTCQKAWIASLQR